MTVNLLDKRRAIAFAHALDHTSTEHSATASSTTEGSAAETGARSAWGADVEDPDPRRLAELAGALGRLPAPELDSTVRSTQRALLVAAMDAGSAPAADPRSDGGRVTTPGGPRSTPPGCGRDHPTSDPHGSDQHGSRPRRWRRRLAIGGAAVGLTGASLGGVAVASSNALPGDTLYRVKRDLENFHVGMTDSDAERGRVFLDMASTRLREARALTERHDNGHHWSPDEVHAVRRALRGMHSEVSQGRNLLRGAYRRDDGPKPMRKLADFTQATEAHWEQVDNALPARVDDVRSRVDALLRTLRADVAPLHFAPQDSPEARGTHDPQHAPSNTPDAPSASARGTGDTPTGSASPAPSSSAPSVSPSGVSQPGDQPSGQASGSDDPPQESPGLLGGLLKTPRSEPSGGSDDSEHEPGDAADKSTPEPSHGQGVTVPPLLPGLPPLGLGGG